MSYKKIISGGALLCTAFLLGGCSLSEIEESVSDKVASVSIPYQWFKDDSKSNEKAVIKEVQGLNLMKEVVDQKGLDKVDSSLSFIEKELSDERNFESLVNDKKSLINILGTEYLDMHYGEKSDALQKAIKLVGETPYQYIGSLHLQQYGVKLDKSGKRQTVSTIGVNAINDTENFFIQTLQLHHNKNGLIVNSVKHSQPYNNKHTVTPLKSDAFLNADTHRNFNQELQSMINAFKNPKLYENISKKSDSEVETSMKSLMKKVGFSSDNQAVVKELIQYSNGTFDHYGITGYLFDDKDVNAKTLYELTISNESGYHHFTICYARETDKIVEIKKGSPFKGEF